MTSTSSRSETPTRTSHAVLVTAPRCIREESDGAIRVERERCHSIDLTNSPHATQRKIPLAVCPASLSKPIDGMLFGSNERDSRNDERQNGPDESGKAATPTSRTNGASLLTAALPLLSLDVSTATAAFVPSLHNDEDDEEDDCSYTTYILGKPYHPKYDYAVRRTDESSLFWFTYRSDFTPIDPYNITTDAGWGCMLRSAQMMLGQVLRMHFKSREWVPPSSIAKRQCDPFLRTVLTLFADYPSTEHIFSLHNMVAAGFSKYETLPGEWYGPGTACYVMRDLVHLQEEREAKTRRALQHERGNDTANASRSNSKPFFRVYVASQGSVYRDAVDELMMRDARKLQRQQEGQRQDSKDASSLEDGPISHPLDPKYDTAASSTPKLPWDTALLILIPLRLGLKVFNEEYAVGLARVFSFRQSVGVLGGRPRGARWFYGADSNGMRLYGLDPHTIQTSPQRKLVAGVNNGKIRKAVVLSEDYLRSVHTTYPDAIHLNRMDPSLALGFYCRDQSEFNDLCESLSQFQKENHHPDLFTIADAVPDYSANVSSVMNEMLGEGIADSFAMDDEGHVSDEDEYVML